MLAHDAWRFVAMFASHAVSQSTPHLYTSMLPFWPAQGPISQHYMKRTFRMIKPTGTAIDRRQVALLTTIPMGGSVQSASFSGDGSRIVVGAGKHVYILDGYTGQTIIGPLEGHLHDVNSVAFSSNSKLVVSGSGGVDIFFTNQRCDLRVWDAQTGKMVIGPLEGHTAKVNSVAFSPDNTLIVSGSDDDTIRLWQTETKTTTPSLLTGHSGPVNSVAFSPNGRYIVSGSSDGTIRLWDAHSSEIILCPRKVNHSYISSVAFSSDGTRIVSGGDFMLSSLRSDIRVWDTQTGNQVLGPLQGHKERVTSVMFSPDDAHIVSGSTDGTVRVWGLQSGTTISQFEGHTRGVNSVAYSPDGTRILSGSHDQTVRFWDVQANNRWSTPLEGHSEPVYSVAFSPDSRYIVSGSAYPDSMLSFSSGAIGMWDVRSGQAITRLRKELPGVMSVALSPDGTRIVAGCTDHTVKVVDARSGEIAVGPLKGHTGRVNSVAFSPNGTLIVSCSQDRTIRLWESQTGETITTLHGHTYHVFSVAFSPSSTCIASGSAGCTLRLWDVQNRSAIGVSFEERTWVCSVAFSPDSTRIVSGGINTLLPRNVGGSIRVRDAHSGQPVNGLFKGHTNQISSVAFSPDSTRIVSGSHDCTVRMWDVQTRETIIGPLEGYTDMVSSVVFSPDGTLIAAGSHDHTIRVWDVSGTLVSYSPLSVPFTHNNLFQTSPNHNIPQPA
jgi:WD40 repeat protein